MAHYALIDENNLVINVIVGIDENNTDELPEGYSSWEDFYGSINNLTCKRTSYNTVANSHIGGGTPFRGNYAGIGYSWDADNEVFLPEQPFNSWTLDSSTWSWVAPLTDPSVPGESMYTWDEDLYQSDNTQGWVQA